MALTKREFAERLRTMNRSGSKAPLQNVQLPTNQNRYQTPSMRSSSPTMGPRPHAPGTSPAALARTGGILGQVAKNAFGSGPESMALDKASSASLGNIAGSMGGLLGSGVDAATGMAGQTANALSNLPQASLIGNGIPAVGEWSQAADWAGANAAGNLGDLSTVNEAVTNATDAANAATEAGANASSYSLPGIGTALGAGLNLAQGNYGKAAGQVAGATAGSFFGPLGTAAGGLFGGLLGGLFD